MAWRKVEPGIYQAINPATGTPWPRYFVKYSIRGKPVGPVSAQTRSIKAARQFLRDQEGRGRRGEPVVSGRLTVGALCDALRDHYEVNDAWTRTKRHALDLIRAELGKVHPADLVTEHHDLILDMQAKWKRAGLTNASVNRYCNFLRRALRLGAQKGRLGTIPIVGRLDESKGARGRYMPPEHAEAIEGELAVWARPLFRVAYEIGQRRGQLARTRREDVDLTPGHEVIAWQPKERKNREPHVVPLVGEALEVVRAAMATRKLGCPYLFHGRRCRPGRATPEAPLGCIGDIKKALEAACARAGLPYGRKRGGYTFHSTRHAAATNLRATMDEADVIKMTGHKTTATFRHHYDHVAAEALRPKVAAAGAAATARRKAARVQRPRTLRSVRGGRAPRP